MSDPYAEYFARGGTITVLPPVYRGEAAAPKPGEAKTLAERVIAIHDAASPGTLHHIKSLLGLEPRIAAAILRAAGRVPRTPAPGEAYRAKKHDRALAGARASAALRAAAARRRLQPMLDLLARCPEMTAKEAARRCGIRYGTTVKKYARLLRGGGA